MVTNKAVEVLALIELAFYDNKKRQMKVQSMIIDVKMMKWQRPIE